ncbi:MotB family protein [Rhodoblastus sp.]|uniref:MotB family protein n=1 Tax=Rhodoblastus sp. TaxID=1962975 RepID=UPI003F9E3CA3
MSEQQQPEIIIVRRRVEEEESHHGGAWKIAYADFVTAMMAFFLVLWILNSTNKDSQTIIARYFNPVKMEDFAKNKKGISEAQLKEEKPGSNEGEPDKTPPNGPNRGKIEERGKDPNQDPNARAMMNEETLFQNPYAALEQIAGKATTQQKQKSGGGSGEAGSLDTYRDPFRTAGVESEGEEEEAPPAPSQSPEGPVKPLATPAEPQEAIAKGQAAASVKIEPAASGANAKAAEAAEGARAATLQKEIGKELKAQAGEGAPRLEVKATDEGLLISLTDNESFGMFEIGSSSPNPRLVHMMDRIAQTLKDQPGELVLRGYTDARRYRGGTSDNWRLSASRAQMALYMLVRGGLPETRVERVEGYADRRLKSPEKPEAAENRRIEILVRKAAP